MPHLNGVHTILLGGWHVEAHLHERHLGVVILVELQRHLILACGALGHVAKGDLEDWLVPNVEGKQLPCGKKLSQPYNAALLLASTNPYSSSSAYTKESQLGEAWRCVCVGGELFTLHLQHQAQGLRGCSLHKYIMNYKVSGNQRSGTKSAKEGAELKPYLHYLYLDNLRLPHYSPPNFTVPQFQPFTHRSFSMSSKR